MELPSSQTATSIKPKNASPQTKKEEWIYVLECQHGCYYVGKTSDPDKRFEEHKLGQGSEWTKLHPPIQYATAPRLITNPEDPGLEEDMETEKWMKRKRVDFVRGGSYSNVKLETEQEKMLKRKLHHDAGKCIECGSDDHYIAHCPNKNNDESADTSRKRKREKALAKFKKPNPSRRRRRRKVTSSEESDSSEESFDDDCCFRCGRDSHWAQDCYATRDVDGKYIQD
eukprot:Stramenopile-MAST_4_protein_4326